MKNLDHNLVYTLVLALCVIIAAAFQPAFAGGPVATPPTGLGDVDPQRVLDQELEQLQKVMLAAAPTNRAAASG